MYEKEKGLVDAFLRGQMDRRSLIRGLGALGVSAATAGVLVNSAATRALAADFDWKKHSGKSLKLLLNKHPYTDAMIANLDNFKELSGMDVTYDVFPEDVYFDKVTAALSSRSSEYDAFMTGAYMTWTYGPAGWITDLNEWISGFESKTNPNYNWRRHARRVCVIPAPGTANPVRASWALTMPSSGVFPGATSRTTSPTTPG